MLFETLDDISVPIAEVFVAVTAGTGHGAVCAGCQGTDARDNCGLELGVFVTDQGSVLRGAGADIVRGSNEVQSV